MKLMRRCGLMARFHGVGGAVRGTAPTTASGSRWRDTTLPTRRAVEPISGKS